MKNNLTLSLYCAGETDKAIALSRQVLMQERYNPHAICNLLLFANGAGKKELVETYRPLLDKADCRETDDDIKVALTYCELGEEEKAYPLFRRALEELPYDEQVLYFAAACAQNLGKYAEAQQYFAEILKLWPQEYRLYLIISRKCSAAADTGKCTENSLYLPGAGGRDCAPPVISQYTVCVAG